MQGKRGTAVLWSLAVAVVVTVGALLPLLWDHTGADLKVYRLGGWTILTDPPALYDARLRSIAMPFTYPVFGALVMIPFAVLTWPLAYAASIVASGVALIAIWRLGLRSFTAKPHPAVLVTLVAASLLLEPVRETLSYGQINLILCAVILYDLLDGKHRHRGLWIGIAAGIKLTPLVFLGLLLVTRQRRALANAAASFLGTVVLGFLVAPGTALHYWTHLLGETTRIGGLAYAGNQSWNGFLIRLSGDLAGGGPVWLVLVVLTAGAGLWLSRMLWLRGQRLAAASVCGLISLFCSPVSWSHHWVWILPCGIALARVLNGRVRVVVVSAWYAAFVLAPIWWPPRSNNRELAWSLSRQVAGNAYIWLALAGALVLATVRKPVLPIDDSGVLEERAELR